MQQNPAVKDILPHYFTNPINVKICVLGDGSINDTFLATAPGQSLVLQRINSQVFPHPQHLIHNLQTLSQHLATQDYPTGQNWKNTTLHLTLSGKHSVYDKNNHLWRAISYIDNSVSIIKAENTFQAEQTGRALGAFHKRIAGLSPQDFKVPLPGFHILSLYLAHYDTLEQPESNTSARLSCVQIIDKERDTALTLEKNFNRGIVSPAIIHGDPKIGNILFDKTTGKAVSIIDLDTVGPGLLQQDIGDCLRSVCNRGGEDNPAAKTVFDLSFCQAVLEGYRTENGKGFTNEDAAYIYDGLYAVTFELGLRFFTDYLQGNIYFKCNTSEENLQKSLTQFALLRDISQKKERIHSLIQQLSNFK